MARGQLTNPPEGLAKLDLKTLSTFYNNELCAEHDGTVADFELLGAKLEDLADYQKIFVRKRVNLASAGLYAGYSAAGVLTVAAVAYTGGVGAGPVAAALGKMGLLGVAGTGTAISSLSGAALTSASLAAIGGSMATGTAIVSATGLALGGIRGGVVANNYHSADASFAIRKLTDSPSSNRSIVVNGWTEQENNTFQEWTLQQLAFDESQAIYGVNWGSKSRRELAKAFHGGIGSSGVTALIKAIGKAGGKKAASKLNPAAWLALIADFLDNPWHTAMVRASQAGVQLAEAVSRTQGQQFTLIGHSLGCRVIYYALQALNTKREMYVSNVLLLGGAVGRADAPGWKRACEAVGGKIFNCYSDKDDVLKLLYKTANAGLSDPIGLAPIALDDNKIENLDCSDLVDSHLHWKRNYTGIVQRIRSAA
jgi:hypothetical protein